MNIRGLSEEFLAAMREKMDSGRRKGRVGWDRHWIDCVFNGDPIGSEGALMTGLRREVRELEEALRHGTPTQILEEAADVANFAMMVADFHR